MKKHFLTLMFLLSIFCLTGNLQAQVTIGSNTPPNLGTLLDLKQNGTTTKGLSLPRVALSDINQLTISSNAIPNTDNAWQEHAGLIVYNTATDINTCLFPGIFIWDSTQWDQLSGGKDAEGDYASDVAALTAFREANTSNTLDWMQANPMLWAGTTWQSVCGEVRLVKLNVYSRGIDKDTGLSDLHALTELNCGNNLLLASLDVSKNTVLTHLNCSYNNLASLDVSKNTALTYLDCVNNLQLMSLDVSKNTALTYFDCRSTNLASLDVSKNTALTSLACSYNNLTSLDVSKNTALRSLNCNSNNLTSLDLSKNIALTFAECSSNSLLASLDVSGATALTYLSCENSSLTDLDVKKNTALTYLGCQRSKLTSLDISKNTALTDLGCNYNYMDQTALNQIATDANNMGKCSRYNTSYWRPTPQYKPNTTDINYALTKPSCP